ncbi:hypothetical protein [Glycomyces sp. NPDC047010]|uniref:hypothetical protein n=1 Tax=Glycomyces sp. NPDC047010 TaxID=3155023 RepID=UPI0033D9FC11
MIASLPFIPQQTSSRAHAAPAATTTARPRLIVVGFDEIVVNKYLPTIRSAIEEGRLDSYAVIDLASQRQIIEARLAAAAHRPHAVAYVPDAAAFDPALQQRAIDEAVRAVSDRGRPVMMYIATEVRAHLPYLQYCAENAIAALVEKPVLAPLESGTFAPADITGHMRSLADRFGGSGCSVMTLSRYHRIYNDRFVTGIRDRMHRWQTPLTSLHLRAAGGVWNTQTEFASRTDHPYRYGYGMLMHGAYHYIDLAMQVLALNADLLPEARLALDVTAYSVGPADQHRRVTGPHAAAIGDRGPRLPAHPDGGHYGETDVTAVFRLYDSDTHHTITLGTLAFEQTTPSIRTWPRLPEGLYNKNGRTSAVDVEAQIGPLYSAHVHCYDVPSGEDADRIDAFARLTERANAALIPDESYVESEDFSGVFHSDSNRALMERWLAGIETRSSLASHALPMRVTEALCLAAASPGTSLTVTDFAPERRATRLLACRRADAKLVAP